MGTDAKAFADTEFGELTSKFGIIATELKSQTDALNKEGTDATAAIKSAEEKIEFGEENQAELAKKTIAITEAKESCDGAWKIAQALKTTNDKANEESCEMDFNFLKAEKTMINSINVKVKNLLSKLKDSQKDYKSDESSVTANAVDTATASSPQ